MAFTPQVVELNETAAPNFYSHGYTPEEVKEITEKRDKILSRNLREFPTTLEEFRDIIIPWCRMNRTQEFILNTKKKEESAKPKREKKEKTPSVKEPKVKKLTKKEITSETQRIYMKQFSNQELSEEEKTFYETYMRNSLI